MEEEKNKQKIEEKKEEKVSEVKKPEVKIQKSRKHEAIANGLSLHTSKKHCMYIGSFIKGKSIDLAIAQLQEVIKMKRAIPFKGEIPHRSDPGMMSGRYPVSASKIFISLLRGLKGNVLDNGMDLDKTRISLVSASWASRPARAGGVRAKRTNVILKAKEFDIKEEKK